MFVCLLFTEENWYRVGSCYAIDAMQSETACTADHFLQLPEHIKKPLKGYLGLACTAVSSSMLAFLK